MGKTKKVLAWLLFQANSKPISKQDFYPIKTKILNKYGKLVKFEFQHFNEKECFACLGSGKHYNYDEEDYEECYKCNGTGVYLTEKWIGLKKISFGKYNFHQITGVLEGSFKYPQSVNVIEGVIPHTEKGYSKFANIVLYSIYGPKFAIKRFLLLPITQVPRKAIHLMKSQLQKLYWSRVFNKELPF